jgi:hypothetical protein
MNIVILNEKIKKANGDLQPLRYENAQYETQGAFLVITYSGERGRRHVARIPIAHVAQIIEDLPPES